LHAEEVSILPNGKDGCKNKRKKEEAGKELRSYQIQHLCCKRAPRTLIR
jgi:hypothetical protein